MAWRLKRFLMPQLNAWKTYLCVGFFRHISSNLSPRTVCAWCAYRCKQCGGGAGFPPVGTPFCVTYLPLRCRFFYRRLINWQKSSLTNSPRNSLTSMRFFRMQNSFSFLFAGRSEFSGSFLVCCSLFYLLLSRPIIQFSDGHWTVTIRVCIHHNRNPTNWPFWLTCPIRCRTFSHLLFF